MAISSFSRKCKASTIDAGNVTVAELPTLRNFTTCIYLSLISIHSYIQKYIRISKYCQSDGLLNTSQKFYCGRKFCELNEPPSTSFEEAPSQRSSTVAYTERKSVEYFRLPFSSRLLRLGGSPKMPLFTALPSTNIGAAVP